MELMSGIKLSNNLRLLCLNLTLWRLKEFKIRDSGEYFRVRLSTF